MAAAPTSSSKPQAKGSLRQRTGPTGRERAVLDPRAVPGHGTVELAPFRLSNKSRSVIGSLGVTHHSDYLTVIRLAQRFGSRLRFADLITHRFALPELERAVAAMRSGNAIKAVIVPARERA
jgi:Zn-dependent alcohol dehydrogenase